MAKAKYNLQRAFRKLVLDFQRCSLIPSMYRYKLLKLAGIKIHGKPFIGQDVIFDSMAPENIEIEDGARITMRSIILTHFYNPNGQEKYPIGKVHIGRFAFIGANSVICKPVSIGDYSTVAAGAVVTKDIPPRQIWGGVPARFIKEGK